MTNAEKDTSVHVGNASAGDEDGTRGSTNKDESAPPPRYSNAITTWFAESLDADKWYELKDIAPQDAAMLLCCFNPMKESYVEKEMRTSDELNSEDLDWLIKYFKDEYSADKKPRSLRDWYQFAKDKKFKYHSWIDGYMESTTQPAPAQSIAAPTKVVIHSTKQRRDTLTPVIEFAQSQCRNPNDTAEVWAALLVLAENKHPPLIGVTEEGLQHFKDGGAAIFKRKSLHQRLTR